MKIGILIFLSMVGGWVYASHAGDQKTDHKKEDIAVTPTVIIWMEYLGKRQNNQQKLYYVGVVNIDDEIVHTNQRLSDRFLERNKDKYKL